MEPHGAGGLIALREARLTSKIDGGLREEARALATALRPIRIRHGASGEAHLLIRDLPIEKSGTPEEDEGPNPRVFDRERLPWSLYEWRLYDPRAEGVYAIDAGPVRLRPLRLDALELGPDGAPLLLSVISAAELIDRPRQEQAPFGDEGLHEGGSPLRLIYAPGASGALEPVAAEALSGGEARLSFALRPRLSVGGTGAGEEAAAFLTFTLLAQDGALRVAQQARDPLAAEEEGLSGPSLSFRAFGRDLVAYDGALKLDEEGLAFLWSRPEEAKAEAGAAPPEAREAEPQRPTPGRREISSGSAANESQKSDPPDPAQARKSRRKSEAALHGGSGLRLSGISLRARRNGQEAKLDLSGEVELGGAEGPLRLSLGGGAALYGLALRIAPEGFAADIREGALSLLISGEASEELFAGFPLVSAEGKAQASGIVAAIFGEDQAAPEAGWDVAQPLAPTAARAEISISEAGGGPLLSFRLSQTLRAKPESDLRIALGMERGEASVVEWPVGGLLEDKVFQGYLRNQEYLGQKIPDPENPGYERVRLDGAPAPARHEPRFARLMARIGPEDLRRVRGLWVLARPIRFKAAVRHKVSFPSPEAPSAAAWWSVDDVALVDLNAESLGLASLGRGAHGFSPRYVDGRALSYAPGGGFARDTLFGDVIGRILSRETESFGRLAFLGGSVCQIALDDEASEAAVLALPWIAPAHPGGDLGPLSALPQRPAEGAVGIRVAAFDLDAARIFKTSPKGVLRLAAVQNEAEAIDAALERAFGAEAKDALRAVDRTFAENLPQNEEWGEERPFERPIFWRALTALAGLRHHSRTQREERFAATLLGAPKEGRLHRYVLRALPPPKAEAEAVDLVVLARGQIAVEPVPKPLAAGLEWAGEANPRQESRAGETSVHQRRRQLALMAAEVFDRPLAIYAARVAAEAPEQADPLHDAFRPIEPIAAAARPRGGRRLSGPRIFPSPALGWPRAFPPDAEARALSIGEEAVLQDETLGWAGRRTSGGVERRRLMLVDRAEYDPGETAHFAFGLLNPNFENPAAPKDEQPFLPGDEVWSLHILHLQPAGPQRPQFVKTEVFVAPLGGRATIRPGRAYALPIRGLRTAAGEGARPEAGDRVSLVAAREENGRRIELSVDFAIVGEPVVPPPAAI